MEYILKEKLNIVKPLIFLCGPLYEEKPHDRRKILKDFLIKDFSKPVLPIIVDSILNKEKINDDTIKIPLMEEICAAVSAKTYIFLDTFSAVAELGIFSSATYANKICVILPNSNDKLTNGINFFVLEIINSSNNIDQIFYRPRITRVPIASDFVSEYYEFPYNKVPKNLKKYIIGDTICDNKPRKIEIKHKPKSIENFHEINYSKDQNEYIVNINLKTLFYIVASIQAIKAKEDPEHILEDVKRILQNSLATYNGKIKKINSITINTDLLYDEIEIIRHIVKFIELYYKPGQATGGPIITKETAIIQKITAFHYFKLNSDDRKVIESYNEDQETFIEHFKVKQNKKTRMITKYNETNDGESLRALHSKIAEKLLENYAFADTSYAYRKGYGILQCVEKHQESCGFLIIDIKNFFNSIRYSTLYNILKKKNENKFSSDKDFQLLVKSLMYNNQVSLGYVTSPLLSEIYLHDFDLRLIDRVSRLEPRLVYTRYADDMVFSSPDVIAGELKELIIDIITEELELVNLEINANKTRVKYLKNIGDHVKILGLNIVKQKDGNKITVGKKYIYQTAKLYLDYLIDVKNKAIAGEDKFYMEKIISGRVAYIKQIEGKHGFELLKERLRLSTDNRVIIEDDIIKF